MNEVSIFAQLFTICNNRLRFQSYQRYRQHFAEHWPHQQINFNHYLRPIPLCWFDRWRSTHARFSYRHVWSDLRGFTREVLFNSRHLGAVIFPAEMCWFRYDSIIRLIWSLDVRHILPSTLRGYLSTSPRPTDVNKI